MAAVSGSPHPSRRVSPPGRLLRAAGAVALLASLAGSWRAGRVAEDRLRDAANIYLARTASAYLSLTTPAGPSAGFDPRRLVSDVNALAVASTWPGGLQLAVGGTPLLGDSLGLAPLPDSLSRLLDEGRPLLLEPRRGVRVAVVPFAARNGLAREGWLAVWGGGDGLRDAPLVHTAGVVVVGTALTLLFFAVLGWPGGSGTAMLAAAALGVASLDGARLLRAAAIDHTDTRLRTVQWLIETAASADGVVQARLPGIAAGATTHRLLPPAAPVTGVVRLVESGGPVARIIAATPQTHAGLEVRVVPAEAGLAPTWRLLGGWGVLGLCGAALAAGLGARSTVSLLAMGTQPKPGTQGAP